MLKGREKLFMRGVLVMNSPSEEYKEDITIRIIKALEKGTAPWQKPWADSSPRNAVTGNLYHGFNAIILSVIGNELSENSDARWATLNQAASKGWTIKDGAKPTKIFVVIQPESKSEVNSRKRTFRKTFELYHASQINGIKSLPGRKHEAIMSNEMIERIIFNSSARILEGGNEAYYSPRGDVIRMPFRKSFDDTESYYSTLLHELVHWTGHSSRLERFFSWTTSREDYARKELVAEIASLMLTVEAGISLTEKHFESHSAYVKSWISLLKSDHDAIFKAEKDAKKAVNFILSFLDDKQENIAV